MQQKSTAGKSNKANSAFVILFSVGRVTPAEHRAPAQVTELEEVTRDADPYKLGSLI